MYKKTEKAKKTVVNRQLKAVFRYITGGRRPLPLCTKYFVLYTIFFYFYGTDIEEPASTGRYVRAGG